jgi:uncharacterized protein (DUF2147 family)
MRIAALLILLPVAAHAADDPVWHNPSNSVHVRSYPCGKNMCGSVVWANDKATADARRGGTDPLVGAELFRDFAPDGPDLWRGKVFVPDINKTFSGTVRRIDDDTLEAKGCLVGRIGCRSQVWKRVR